MQKTIIDIADLMPERIIQEIRNFLDLYIKGIEAASGEQISYEVEMGTITLDISLNIIDLNADIIKRIVLHHFNRDAGKIFYKGKGSGKREVAYPRYIAIRLIDQYTRLTLSEIGKEVGGYDHATMLHAKKTIKDLYEVDRTVKNDINELEKIINKKLGREIK